ncbi:MAG: alpha/beta hydrolase [Erysipelotrichaceae bacterium]|nr:alpha/beta hydrolase [Erysipelotrichaceae bacterium]
MIHETINLKNIYKTLKNDVFLTSFCPENYNEFSINKKRKCVLVIPGGGYAFVSERESEPVALRFAGNNIAAFTIKYSVVPNITYPLPFVEVFAALSYIRRNAEHYHIDKDAISLCGFSAGGHLAASCSAYHEDESFAKYLNINLDEMKVNGCILGYPVISSNSYRHQGTFENFSNNDQSLMEKFSIEKHVSPSFPKTFIWHTTFDNCVSVKNSLCLAKALADNHVFMEMHIYPMHDHGQSLADDSVYNDAMSKQILQEMKYNTQWIDNAIHFVKEYI